MALYIPQSILHLARSLYVRPETYGPTYVGLLSGSQLVQGTCTKIWNVCIISAGKSNRTSGKPRYNLEDNIKLMYEKYTIRCWTVTYWNESWHCFTLKMRAIWSFESSETTHPTTQDHISQDFRNVTVRTLNLEQRCTFAFHKRKCSWMLAVTGDDCTWSPGVLYFLLLGNKLDDSDIAQILGSGASPSVATTAAQHAVKVCRGRECKIPRVLLFSTVTVMPKLLNNWCPLHRKLLVLQSQRERWRREIRAFSWSHIPVTLPMETSNDMFRDYLRMEKVIQFWITRKVDCVRWIEKDL